MSVSHTIFALSCPPGRAALHIHRISGHNVIETLGDRLRTPFRQTSLKPDTLSPTGTAPVSKYVSIVSMDGHLIDDVVLTYFRAPHSYTGEDVVEISTHGNPLIARQLHGLLRELGMRDANPGEFTQRAFLNGKLDLTQAEAIDQLIHAETTNGLLLAKKTNEGSLSAAMAALKNELVEVLAYLEAHIDFGTDEVGSFEPKSLLPKVDGIALKLDELAASYESGMKVRQGVKVALVGRPNVGKSSLYNAILQANRAIVTDIPGTTRDVLEERLVIGTCDFVFVDTAGLRDSSDTVERIGISRTKESASEADVLCVVVDGTGLASALKAPDFLAEEMNYGVSEIKNLKSKHIVVAVSKEDLLSQAQREAFSNLKLTDLTGNVAIQDFVVCSVSNLTQIKSALTKAYESVTHFNPTGSLAPVLISARQQDKVKAARASLAQARQLLLQEDYPEKTASLLNATFRSLDEILGEVTLDSVFDKIFSTFCIGK